MMRILHVIQAMGCGGTENFVMNLYRNIDRTKVQFDFLVTAKNKCFFDDEIESLGGRIFRVRRYKMTNLFSYRRDVDTFFKAHHKEFAAVHGHLGSSACIYLSIANKYGITTIAHSHAINDKQRNLKNYLYKFHAYLSRGVADFYMGCSYEAGIDRYGKKIADSDRFKVIKNGIKSADYIFNPAKRQEIRKANELDGRFVIGHVGRFNFVKNHAFMLDVLKVLKEKGGDYCLMLVGDGEMKESIQSKAKALGIAGCVKFMGVRKDVPDMLQAMDFFIFPSFNEGLGIGLIEAQASGLPCIANSEGIISLAKVTPLVTFLPISAGAEKWANYIEEFRNCAFERTDTSGQIKKSGFDVEEVSAWLTDFYYNFKK